MDWLGYCRRLLVTALVLAALLYGFIIVLDPYQNVPFAPSAPASVISSRATM